MPDALVEKVLKKFSVKLYLMEFRGSTILIYSMALLP
jgi:hypothetical protein